MGGRRGALNSTSLIAAVGAGTRRWLDPQGGCSTDKRRGAFCAPPSSRPITELFECSRTRRSKPGAWTARLVWVWAGLYFSKNLQLCRAEIAVATRWPEEPPRECLVRWFHLQVVPPPAGYPSMEGVPPLVPKFLLAGAAWLLRPYRLRAVSALSEGRHAERDSLQGQLT